MTQKDQRPADLQAGATYLARFPSFAKLRDQVSGGRTAVIDALDLIQVGVAPGEINIQALSKYWHISENHAYFRLRQVKNQGLMNVEKLGNKIFKLSYVNQ